MQVSLLGFMDKYGAAAFMDQLWTLLLSAQKTVGGVPAEVSAQSTIPRLRTKCSPTVQSMLPHSPNRNVLD